MSSCSENLQSDILMVGLRHVGHQLQNCCISPSDDVEVRTLTIIVRDFGALVLARDFMQ